MSCFPLPLLTQIYKTLLYKGSGAPVRAICVSPDGQYLATGDESGAVILWELSCGKELAKINLNHHGSGQCATTINSNIRIIFPIFHYTFVLGH